MFATERDNMILQYLEDNGITRVESLTKLTGASIATVRRDVNRLHKMGLIEKTRGTARIKESNAGIDFTDTDDDPYARTKDRIARVAVDLIRDGDTVFIGAGKTCSFLAKYLNLKNNLTVVTTNVNAVMELAKGKKHAMVLLGGDIHVGSGFVETLDDYSVYLLRNLYFNKVFITVNGVDLQYGYSINSRLQVPLYSHLMSNTQEFYLLVDSSKFNKRAFAMLCDVQKIRNIVTCSDTDPIYLDFYKESGIVVYTEND